MMVILIADPRSRCTVLRTPYTIRITIRSGSAPHRTLPYTRAYEMPDKLVSICTGLSRSMAALARVRARARVRVRFSVRARARARVRARFVRVRVG